MAEPGTRAPIEVVHNPQRHRYELHDGGVIGFTKYRLGEGKVIFIHTEVDDAYSGQGLASKLARYALDDVRASGRRIVPLCPYIASWLRKHHDFDDIVDWPAEQEG
ncbi:N-acetyltransferase [Arthrobacter sp. I2-34]|uniref:N-acetyltransferase n=1 Tax=Arthrobacter hankyongi TaxID=2904801 RepID=A0ABS9L5C7_9MICC|nr:GNAT family N-acetyltransferase [Arthrobacter hankyongi]MCG2621880.1 N-acetyltransferase [Arthrobacter hankyongi]